jgi:beta-N-acetylhexosaminidase
MQKKQLLIIGALTIALLASVTTWLFISNNTKLLPMNNSNNSSHSPTTHKKPIEDRLACVDALPDNIKIGQKIMAAVYNDQLSDEQVSFIQSGIGGVIIMNEISASSLSTFRTGFKIAPTIATDQEGGSVQRFTNEGILPGAADMASGYTSAQAYSQYLADAKYLKTIGITTNFAPIVDVLSTRINPLPGRIYSSNPSVVTAYASEDIKAAQAAGIAPVIKHFPGLGSATGNTDYGSATTDFLSVLKTRDLVPYQQLAKYETDVMINNAITPGLTNEQPAVWSPAAVSLLRSYGYQNSVVYSDSLTAQAIPGTLDNAVIKAWQAGVDVALIVQTQHQTPELEGDFQSILTRATSALQSGQLKQQNISQSVLRILQRKNIDPCGITAS